MELQRLVRAARDAEPSGISPRTAGRIAREIIGAVGQEPTAAP